MLLFFFFLVFADQLSLQPKIKRPFNPVQLQKPGGSFIYLMVGTTHLKEKT